MSRLQKDPITTLEMRVVERNAEFLGISHSLLMQNAGREVARVVSRKEKVKGKKIAIVCGLGGNGGDGMVAARYLDEEGANVEVYLVGNESAISNEDTFSNWEVLLGLENISKFVIGTESSVQSSMARIEADILIDAMMGFGLHSKLREPLLSAVKLFNKSTSTKYAIDLPTGIDSDTGKVHGAAVKADHTIALHAPKLGAEKATKHAGKMHVVSIGIPAEAGEIAGPGDLIPFSSPRDIHAKKGDFGRVLVVGGSDVFSGAPALCGLAALRTGSDLVTILAPDPMVTPIRSYSPNLMVKSLETGILLPESVDRVLKEANEQDAVAIGPGLGQDQQTRMAVLSVVENLVKKPTPLVLDADGLKALASSELKLTPSSSVLTPHWGELKVILDKKDIGSPDDLDNRRKRALEGAELFDSVLLLKGHVDIIAHPDGRYRMNRTGVPAMTVGGTGDVLTGIAVSLLGQGGDAFRVACAAAYVSGTAGEFAHAKLGDHLLATDCIDEIPFAFDWS
ncbi:NAD(P)H-hydrate dehydratase [Candidatus Thorarchaeota archaeon]|nr:MAG: NAD(P)H-hydrate dehydratase [Candidatus Thorarchaeota archaeon]